MFSAFPFFPRFFFLLIFTTSSFRTTLKTRVAVVVPPLFAMWKRKSNAPAVRRTVDTPAAGGIEAKARGAEEVVAVASATVRPEHVLTPTIQADQLAWELAIATKPITQWPILGEDTLQAWHTLGQANDPKTMQLIEKHKLVKATLGVALDTFERFIYGLCYDMVDRNEMRMCANGSLFSLRSGMHVGSPMDAFMKFAFPSIMSGHDRKIIQDNENLVHGYVGVAVREAAKVFVFDTALVKHSKGCFTRFLHALEEEGGGGGGGAGDSDGAGWAVGATHRVKIPLPKHSRPQTACPENLLVLVGSMLVPPCAASHTWKTLIIATGSKRVGTPHIIDRICSDFIGFGLTTDMQVAANQRTSPYLLRIDEWKDTVPFKNRVHDLLKVGVVVVVRCTDGVPLSIVQEPRLRLCAQTIRACGVSDEVWNEEAGMLFRDAVDAYRVHAHCVQVPDVPYPSVVQGKAYRPNPMVDGSMNVMAFYLAEMLHARFGIRLFPGGRVALAEVELVLGRYAVLREFQSSVRKLTAEDVLEAASAVREAVDDVVTYHGDSKSLVNIALCY
jgi:hypothetical protein